MQDTIRKEEETPRLIKPVPYYLGVRYVPFWKLMWAARPRGEELPSEHEAALTREGLEQEPKADIEQKLDAILASSRSVTRKAIRKSRDDRTVHIRPVSYTHLTLPTIYSV
eukprot:TRINITY_DN8962_c0_g1_i9.p1 TRINITY_DN8962_c0_g1~~TRINITY_DN8962_c0_g1_i9.p1  ORF type:complete len:111 (-),score=31.06 TRINITY_DN8962_c0_g1_i9:47-379(-)